MSELFVPIRADALWVKRTRRVIGTSADVERLPWFDGRRDRNGSVPHVASAINAQPFGEHLGWLDPGVHLHWSLPDALTRGATRADAVRTVHVDDLWFAPAPNRWLVLLRKPAQDADKIVRMWMVESDFVHAHGKADSRAIAYPLSGTASGSPPYVKLGRQVELDVHQIDPIEPGVVPATAQTSLESHGATLTALGPGDPLFAAHYPSCQSVFGFHEAVPASEWGEARHYTVFGWYRELEADPLARLTAALRAEPVQALSLLARAAQGHAAALAALPADAPALTRTQHEQALRLALAALPADAAAMTRAQHEQALRLALAQRFGWKMSDASLQEAGAFPGLVICLGSTTVTPGVEAPEAPPPEGGRAGIGSSAAEAMAALLMDHADLDGPQQDRLVQALAGTDMSHHALDLGAKLAEARHREQFQAQRGHAVWVIRAPESHDAPGAAQRAELPEDLAHELNQLNLLQERYDRALDHLAGLRQALFADWHRWMTTVYPESDADAADARTRDPFAIDPDALRELIERTRLQPLEALRDSTGQLLHGRTAGGGIVLKEQPAKGGGNGLVGDTLAGRIVDQYRALSARLAEAAPAGKPYTLGVAPGPRFWRPNDLVLVLDEALAAASPRHGDDGRDEPDGLHPCHATGITGGKPSADSFRWWPLGPPMGARAFGWWPQFLAQHPEFVTRSDGENWHPVQLEWEVEVQLLGPPGSAERPRYPAGFIGSTHTFPADVVDLAPRAMSEGLVSEYVAGRTMLNPAAGRLLQRERLPHVPADLPLAPGALAGFTAAGARAPMVLTLGGFHDRLLLCQQEPQLTLDDPIGLPAQKAFTDRVRVAMGGQHPSTPVDEGAFHPIRAGEIVVERLRVIDSFGRTKTWRPARLLKTLRMAPADKAFDRARLPLRLAQAARLDFRWLSGTQDGDIESNDHPASSPVCGWLLPDELDGALQVHAPDGRLLGSVAAGGLWQPAPGDPSAPRRPSQIAQSALRRVVQWLTAVPMAAPTGALPADTVGDFVDLLDSALETIDPNDSAHQPARALLVARPLAVLRARLALVLQHPEANDPTLGALRARLAGGADDDRGLGAVRLPLRLGAAAQRNDGLCGYWIEDGGAFLDDVFHAPHGLTGASTHPRLDLGGHVAPGEFPIQLTPDGTATLVTLLVEPHGVVHANCGVLPVKSIAIPPDQVAAPLAALRATFPVGPLLTAPDALALPLPSEPGFAWSWLERRGDRWTETPQHPIVHKADLQAGFGTVGEALWSVLVAHRRIELSDAADRGTLMPADRKALAAALTPLGLNAEAVERGLHSLAVGIDATDTAARDGKRAVARDGWLQLRRAPRPHPGSGS
jgi:hypothetical protein